jgi:hypothetical protein
MNSTGDAQLEFTGGIEPAIGLNRAKHNTLKPA